MENTDKSSNMGMTTRIKAIRANRMARKAEARESVSSMSTVSHKSSSISNPDRAMLNAKTPAAGRSAGEMGRKKGSDRS